ncbi:hypothetical protein JYU29_06020 [Tianweitania sp. BSSL-BM11]|uniref:Uncharacterized protein n=1 Tax=Tianweitania aestuarii TaxID=2814886 RepID=A0ABS5RVD8_9HYPH|nr:hypothetical protein [Tianweitania aestuarii]MBS9720241.1 hypothetical protein [Tianweitania aestuarii]
MRLLHTFWRKHRAGRLIRRMERLHFAYKLAILDGDRHGARFIREDIDALDQRLSALLDRWEADIAERKAVRP